MGDWGNFTEHNNGRDGRGVLSAAACPAADPKAHSPGAKAVSPASGLISTTASNISSSTEHNDGRDGRGVRSAAAAAAVGPKPICPGAGVYASASGHNGTTASNISSSSVRIIQKSGEPAENRAINFPHTCSYGRILS